MTPLAYEEYRRYAFVLAIFALGLYLALVVASFGMLSLFLNREVVSQSDAGPLVGPAMVGAAIGVLLIVMWAAVARLRAPMHTVPVSYVVLASALSYLAYGLVGGIVYGLGERSAGIEGSSGVASEPVSGLIFLSQQLTSPFAAAVAAWSAVVALLYFVLLIWRANGGQRPRWPWEKRGT